MSLPGSSERAGVEEIRDLAAEWLLKRQEAGWSERDQRGLDAWFAQDSAHRIAYLRLETAWRTADRLTALRRPMRDAGAPQRRNWSGTVLLKVTAAVAVVTLAGAAAFYPFGSPERTYATGLGGREIVKLADGSQIELNTNSEIRSPAKAGRRFTLVKGEAYFQVHHDAAHPFVVSVGDHRIVDLGTKFLVRRDPNQVQVSLLEGSARLESTRGGSAKAAVLVPGDIAIATADALSVMKKPKPDLADELGWRRGVLVFHRTTLGDAAAEFNRYSQQKVAISDPEVASLTISGTFPVGGIRLFSDAARDSFGLSVSHSGGQTFISKRTP